VVLNSRVCVFKTERERMANGWGGPRPGSGRPVGRKSSSTLKREAALRRAAARNLGPVEFLLNEMRDLTLPARAALAHREMGGSLRFAATGLGRSRQIGKGDDH